MKKELEGAEKDSLETDKIKGLITEYEGVLNESKPAEDKKKKKKKQSKSKSHNKKHWPK